MSRGRPREYDKRFTVTTNIEADLYHFGKDKLDIPASEAISLGYMGRIDSELLSRKDILKEDLHRYFIIRDRIYRDLVLSKVSGIDPVSLISDIATDIDNTSIKEVKSEAERHREEIELKSKKIRVHDKGDDTRKIITLEQYQNDPDSYNIIPDITEHDEEEDQP